MGLPRIGLRITFAFRLRCEDFRSLQDFGSLELGGSWDALELDSALARRHCRGTVYPEKAYDLPGVVWWLDQIKALGAK